MIIISRRHIYLLLIHTFQKDLSINEEIDRLRLRATASILEGRKDVIVVSSVSCIYGIRAPEEYAQQVLVIKTGDKLPRKKLMSKLIDIHYVRNDTEFKRGTFRVGEIISKLFQLMRMIQESE